MLHVKSHRTSKFVGLLLFDILLQVVAGLDDSVVLSFGGCMLKTVVPVAPSEASVITFSVWNLQSNAIMVCSYFDFCILKLKLLLLIEDLHYSFSCMVDS